ncbi:PAAR domain-containing protein [Cupriavidus basilensis]|uniref:PAAR domain-containing protein n=1 Tax=Cupriavidus basilensis TaxID=68895 RepID=UPI0039F6F347
MMRRVACVGDRLSPDGVILPYDGPVFTIGDGAGHQVALIGGQAYCEACKSTGIIAKAGGPSRISFMGETAADGDIVLCKCPTHPSIIATLAGETWCDDEAESAGMASVQEAIAGTSDFTAAPFFASNPRYDQQVQLLDEESGQPLARRRYRLTGDGGSIEARTDDSGMTERISSDTAATMTLEIFGEDA